MNRYEEMTTDQLVEELVLKVRTPLPGYNYKDKCYVSMVPLPKDQVKPEMKITEMYHGQRHHTYREACLRILQWHQDKEMKELSGK
jgi:hypothetical protein